MRDAFGGAFMIKLFLVFIFIYICFTAVALSYAKAFKVKNSVIEFMENWEITSLDNITATKMEEFGNYINKEIVGNMNYNMSSYNICKGYPKTNDAGRVIGICDPAGVIVEEIGYAKNTEGRYYRVCTYLGYNIGFLNKLTELNSDNETPGIVTGTWRICGETRVFITK